MKRKLFEKLLKHLPRKEFCILTGARQTGKSTLLKELQQHCDREGQPTVFINLEQQSVLQELEKDPLNIISYLPASESKAVIFMDEIQYLSNPSNFLKLLHDEQSHKLKIVASGSSAFYIDHKFTDSLAGRKRIFHLRTCDFEEYLGLQGKADLWQEVASILNNKNYKSLKLNELKKEWYDYLIYGGYPAVVTESSKAERREMLIEIRDSFVKRDVAESGVQNELVFYQLFKILAEQTGQLLNVNELSNTLKVRRETIQNYLEVLQKCFHLTLVRPFSTNMRKELTKMPKPYLMDTGMRNCLLNNFQSFSQRVDRGSLWELGLFRMLVDKYNEDGIHFWRTSSGKEVDFVIPDENPPVAVECKFDLKSVRMKKYESFQVAYPNFRFSVAHLEPFSEELFRAVL